MKFLGVLVMCLTAVSGFVAPTPRVVSPQSVVRSSSSAMRMGLKEDVQKAATAASVAVLTAAPAFATEGTGEPLGIEEGKAIIIPLALLVSINLFFNNWAKDQPEGDFFSEYDTRK